MSGATDSAGCGGHSGMAAELRTLVVGLLDRVQPALDRFLADDAAPQDAPSTCASCPVCALIAVLRGERPELAARLAEQTGGLITVLRAALDEGGGATPAPTTDTAPEADPPASRPRVQHISVSRG